MGRLQGKSALITGGASGIGLAAAQAFVREGAKVMLVDRDQGALEAAVKDLGAGNAVAHYADTAQVDAAETFVRAALEKFGGLDIAVLNAGVGSLGLPVDGYPIDEFDRVVGVNLRGVWLTLRACVRVMKPRKAGSIIVTGSIHSHAARALSSPYTTAKAGLLGMVKGAALEMAGHGVRVNMVAPGFIDTPLLRKALDAIVPKGGVSGRDALARNIPMRRLGASEEVAEVMLFLASDEASYTTGASFAADGGVLAAWGPTPD